MRNGNVIDFVYEWYRRNSADRSNRIGELALGKCEDAFMRRDWQGFAQWHGVFGRARRSAGSGVGNGSPRGGRGSRPTRD